MAKDKLFVSYHHDDNEDRYKYLLKAWSRSNDDFFKDIKFDDLSLGISINSRDSYYIKRKIMDQIINCDTFLCLIGKDTYLSDWVNWEINIARKLGKEIVAIKIREKYKTPTYILGIGASWARSFNALAIKNALK